MSFHMHFKHTRTFKASLANLTLWLFFTVSLMKKHKYCFHFKYYFFNGFLKLKKTFFCYWIRNVIKTRAIIWEILQNGKLEILSSFIMQTGNKRLTYRINVFDSCIAVVGKTLCLQSATFVVMICFFYWWFANNCFQMCLHRLDNRICIYVH